MNIINYSAAYRDTWNAFIEKSINGTFLFHRDFMEYHSDRFTDASLLVFDNGQLVCCVPASTSQSTFYSHQGLTYGGFVLLESTLNVERIIQVVLEHLYAQDYSKIVFNMQLSFYNMFASSTKDVLEKNGFAISRELCNMQSRLDQPVKISSKKSAGYRNGKFDDLTLKIEQNYDGFWNEVLIPQLIARHNATPVHTLAEIYLLASRFPKNIMQYNVYRGKELLAGATFFLHNNIAKSQYAAIAPAGMVVSAMDFLYIEAMQELTDTGYTILDYGPVNERDGSINRGVQRFKEELGCSKETAIQLTKFIG